MSANSRSGTRRVSKIIPIIPLALFLAAILYTGVQSIRLKWWIAPESVQLQELTADQKAADMRYMLNLIGQVSQADAVWQAAGLDSPLDQADIWVERARLTRSNREFADLVLQLLVHAGQAGHAFLAYDLQFNPTTSLVGNIPRDAFYKMPQWEKVIASLAWNAHSKLNPIYHNGQYVLKQDVTLGEIFLPAGSIVESVNGLATDEFILQQQYRAHLRFDPALDKFFLYPLFMVDPGSNISGWEVVFRLPNGNIESNMVAKYSGYVPHRPDENRADNTRCLPLNEEVLYIKMLTFYREHAAQDATTLRKCFGMGNFQKVIFDVRGNNGGEIWSYMDNIIAPLIRQPLTFETVSAVKESFFKWYGWRFWLYQAMTSNELTDPPAHVEQVKRINYPLYSDQGWRVVKVTRTIQPAAEPLSFDGSVYVLTDNNTLSAGDSFAAVMQRTGLAKIVGTNTAGWGQGYMAKMPCALPNSGLIFYLDSELTLNPDGTLNNYRGVLPDVLLDSSTYPTPYPFQFNFASIKADPWVQWVIQDQP
ncbi:MAG: S41 family peptidase [Chloroflexota bacterium]